MASRSVSDWVDAAPDRRQRELRQAVHITLVAIAELRRSGVEVVMKGGILVAIGYDGDRYTRDIDFSTRARRGELDPANFCDSLDQAIATAVDRLDVGLDCRVQSHELQPPGDERTWPTLRIRIGYAPSADAGRRARLARKQAADVLTVDVSYNEVITATEILSVYDGADVLASTLADLVAEKYRAMLQQPERNRVRRQDAYDLAHLLDAEGPALKQQSAAVLGALRAKCEARGLNPEKNSLRSPEIKRRSAQEYPQLAGEIERPLPPFEEVWSRVVGYYEELPWQD